MLPGTPRLPNTEADDGAYWDSKEGTSLWCERVFFLIDFLSTCCRFVFFMLQFDYPPWDILVGESGREVGIACMGWQKSKPEVLGCILVYGLVFRGLLRHPKKQY